MPVTRGRAVTRRLVVCLAAVTILATSCSDDRSRSSSVTDTETTTTTITRPTTTTTTTPTTTTTTTTTVTRPTTTTTTPPTTTMSRSDALCVDLYEVGGLQVYDRLLGSPCDVLCADMIQNVDESYDYVLEDPYSELARFNVRLAIDNFNEACLSPARPSIAEVKDALDRWAMKIEQLKALALELEG